MGFRVRRVSDRAIVPGIPTPRLIESASPVDAAEAFTRDGIWYLHEPGTRHVSPTGEYARVFVEHTEDYRVDVAITIPVEDARYSDWFIVEAATPTEAGELAIEAAHREIERQYGDVSSDVTIVRARKGSI